jgi:hypothetical protein
MQTAPSKDFIRKMSHPLLSRLFLFWRLPSAFFSGVRIRELSEDSCTVSVPYKWMSQNPFRSTYFACLSMAGEMSTGALAMAHTFNLNPAMSMLVVKMESRFFKKAIDRAHFTCKDGQGFREAIRIAIETGEPQTFTAKSVGCNQQGEVVAEFLITWSFKSRSLSPKV